MSDTPLTDAAISRRTGYAGYGHIDIGDCRNIERELREDIEALREENERLRKDAQRYRWLREHMTYRDIGYTTDPSGNTGMLCSPVQRRWYHDSHRIDIVTIDAAIDAALAKKEPS